MKSYKIKMLGLTFLFSSLLACVTPEPTRNICRDEMGVVDLTDKEINMSSTVKAGRVPTTASEYNRLIQSGTTNFLLLSDQESSNELLQTKRNLLALGYSEKDILKGQVGFAGSEVESCISRLETLNVIQAFIKDSERRLFISATGASEELPFLGVLYDRFVEKKNFIASFKNRICNHSTNCLSTSQSQSFYKLVKSMELVSPALWQHNSKEFCAGLKPLNELDLKFVGRYLACEENELAAITD